MYTLTPNPYCCRANVQESQGQILALAFRQRSLKPCMLFHLHSEADPSTRPGGNPGENGWFLESTPMQIPPRRGGICGRLTSDLPSTRLQGGTLTRMAASKQVMASSSFSWFESALPGAPFHTPKLTVFFHVPILSTLG